MILIRRTMYDQCRENSIIMLCSHLEIHKAIVIVSFSGKCYTNPTSLFPLPYTDQRVDLLQLFYKFVLERYCQATALTNWVNNMVTATYDNWPLKLKQTIFMGNLWKNTQITIIPWFIQFKSILSSTENMNC